MKLLLFLIVTLVFSIQTLNSDTIVADSPKTVQGTAIDSTNATIRKDVKVTVPKDTTALVKKSFSEQAMKSYRSSDDFVYNEDYSFTSALDKFLDTLQRYFIWLLEKLFGPLFAKNVFEALPNRDIVLYTITFVLLGLIIFFFYKSKLRLLFYKKSKKSSSNSFIEENIHEIDFLNEILIAEEQKKYRLAIRLHFLALLKHLDTIELIHWESQKTNRDYVQELTKVDIRNEFEELVLIFEYVWYGEFTPNEEQYKKAINRFNELRKLLPLQSMKEVQ